MSDFAMHYRTKIEKNNEMPVIEKANNFCVKSDEEKNHMKCSKIKHGDGPIKIHNNNNKNYVTIGYDCLLVDDEGAGDEEEVFKNSLKVEKKNKKLKIKRNKNQTAHELNYQHQNNHHQETSNKNKSVGSADSENEPAGVGTTKRIYKESTSIDSGIECEHNPNNTSVSPNSRNFFETIDNTFGEFLLNSDDNFLDSALDYVLPKFSCNRFENTLAFTLHAKNVALNTIQYENLAEIGAARIKFYSMASQQHFAFFVKITPPISSSCVYTQHFNENNNTAMVTDVSAESWDNNVVFQIELDPVIARDVEEYYYGATKYDLEPKQLNAKVLQGVADPSPSQNSSTYGQEDEGLSIEVENSSESEISIAIKGKENELQAGESVGASGAQSKRRNKKKKNRSLSESCCDELKVISESETLITHNAKNELQKTEIKDVPRKTRSISESTYNSEMSDHHNIIKYKSILKHSSFDSSADDLFYSTSLDIMHGHHHGGGSTDPEMSESCKKSVRFSEHIQRQLYRSTSSILAQKKKNQRKNEAKRRLLERKNSECESTEEIDEIPEIEDQLEEEECEKSKTVIEMTKNKKNKKRSLNESAKNMIFDLEI
uniref:CSON000827 protein n=1 Tax=Culicoides sonorensis TaxID=179676 RepID=A0A336MFW5_CULSO